MKILLIEDDPDIIGLFVLLFRVRFANVDLLCAADLDTARCLFFENQSDIVLIFFDGTLKTVHGDERTVPFAEEIAPLSEQVLKVAFSSMDDVNAELRRARCNVTFRKPFELEELTALISGAISDASRLVEV